MKLFLTALILFCLSIDSAHALKVKIGVLAPEGTSWATNLKKLSKEIKKATDGKVQLKVYYGGSQGDEPDVLRKIRTGQLHGGIFTGKTLGEINGDSRVFEVPFTFHGDSKKANKAITALTPYLNGQLLSSGFENLGFFELGPIYLVTKTEVKSLEELKNLKIWAWQGDPLATSLIESMNLHSVPLALPDVLSSLSTGIIDAAYSPPLAIISLQWHTKTKYLVDFPINYGVGAFLVDKKQWGKISKPHQKIIRDLAEKTLTKLNKANSSENKEALATLQTMGVKFIKFPEADINKAKGIRGKIVEKLQGPLFSKKAYNELEKSRK
jgi:TRAP-type C4-dicarboxylate transport system substrate-binding protein